MEWFPEVCAHNESARLEASSAVTQVRRRGLETAGRGRGGCAGSLLVLHTRPVGTAGRAEVQAERAVG